MNWLTSRGASLVALAALALVGCDKGTDLNVDLPDTASVNTQYKDVPLAVAAVRLAPVQTLKADHFLVGRLADNVAGTTTAGAYFNVIDASIINTLLGSSGGIATDSLPSGLPTPLLDSVVVVAGFDQVYGSSKTPVRFDLYKLAAPLDERQSYDSNSAVAVEPTPIAQDLTSRLDRTQTQVVKAAVAATPTTAGTPAVTTTVADPTVRLLVQRTAVPATPTTLAVSGVSSAFASLLFGQLGTAGFSQTQLDMLLKGLAIQPSASHTGNIVSFSKGYKSRMVVYYHSADLRRVYSIYFGPTYSSLGLSTSRDPRYFTTIRNDLPTSLAALANRSGAVSASALNGVTYAQEGSGLGTRITLPALEPLLGDPSSLIINRAELLVPVKPFTNALYANPGQLYAVEVDAANAVLQRTVNFTPLDRIVQADGYDPLGSGTPATGILTDNGTQAYYTIPVTAYLQSYLNNKLGGNPAALVLVPNVRASAGLSLNRAALDAANIRLRVYYTQKR